MAPACATKKYVRTEVGTVNSKVDTLSGTVEQTQARIQQDETKIGQVDQKAEAAGTAAQAAQNSANQAQQAARQVDTKVDKVNSDLTANINAGRKLVYEVTLSEDQGNFKFGKTELPDEAKARIDQVVSQLKGEAGKDLYIEVEGHTDNVGGKELNYQLGMERAEAVKKYLYTQHQIPLHKINVISYGEDKPVAPNNTRNGRAMNRRVVIRVLS
ncbi:MAG TPA: OmpA family protein [Vicinamibacterales bacterium]|jgi:outer membrane protein OmpA-like peptidoglycan-associated protein|nr:OmpA family protein [Vicinamibacterales bacterium]